MRLPVDASGSNTPARSPEAEYADALRALVTRRLRGLRPGDLTLLDLCRSTRGAFPTEVRAVLPAAWAGLLTETTPTAPPTWSPRLSPVRSEWYYTDGAVDDLVSRLRGRVLVAGGPTLASGAATAGHDVVLVDDSPWARHRVDLSAVDHRPERFGQAELGADHDTVVLDPPWYFPALSSWLRKAGALVRPGGSVLLSMPGTMTRPSAGDDQRALVALAAGLGVTEVERDVLRYGTPLFEREALAAAGLPMTGDWRTGDLLTVRVDGGARTGDEPTGDRGSDLGWSEYRIGEETIAVRDPRRPVDHLPGEPLLREVPGVPAKVLDTVSRRDPRLSGVDVWTSRNRVAGTSRPEELKARLKELEDLSVGADWGTDRGARRQRAELAEIMEWLEVTP